MADEPAQQPANPAPNPEAEEQGQGEESPQLSESEQKLGRRWAQLSKQQRDFKRQQNEWNQEREKGRAELGRISELRKKAPENIAAWLQAGNVSPEALNAFLTQNTQRANDPYEQRISESERTLRQQLEQQAREIQEMKNAHVRGQNIDKITRIVEAKPDDFELIHHFGAQADVADYIELHLAERKERITEAEACAIIERTLEDRENEGVRRALAARKIAKRIGWQQPGESDDDAESQPGDDHGAPAPKSPPAQHRNQPTRGKPKLTNASPSSSRRKTEVKPSGDPYDNKWEQFVASKTKRGK